MIIDFGFDLAGRREPLLVRGALFTALSALLECVPVCLAAYALDRVLGGDAPRALLPWLIGALVGALLLSMLLKSWGGVANFTATYNLVGEIQLRLADHLRRLPMGYWTRQRTGSIGSLLTDEFNVYAEAVTHVWSMVLANLAKPVALAIVMIAVEWRVGLVAAAMLPIAFLAVPWSHRLLNRASDALAETRSDTYARIVEYIQGASTLRAFSAANAFRARLHTSLDALEVQQMRMELAPAPAVFAYALLTWLGFSLVFVMGAWGVAQGWLTPVRLLVLLLLALQLFSAAGELGALLAVSRFAARIIERIRDLFALPPQPDATAEPALDGEVLRVEDLSFSYTDRPALTDVSATFTPGTITALVGPSGSGKSTLAHLLLRLWDADQGRIQLGGVDIRDIPLRIFRQHVAAVLQDVVLFEQSVADNIRLGRPTMAQPAVEAAARAARAHGFITGLPEGYATVLAEGGNSLSGGERQRVSVARALLQDAPILVLDEATSSVDSQNEPIIQAAIAELAAQRTVIIIAHRLWTIQHADQILVLDKGRIVERGQHADLLAQQGLYARLWHAQQGTAGPSD